MIYPLLSLDDPSMESVSFLIFSGMFLFNFGCFSLENMIFSSLIFHVLNAKSAYENNLNHFREQRTNSTLTKPNRYRCINLDMILFADTHFGHGNGLREGRRTPSQSTCLGSGPVQVELSRNPAKFPGGADDNVLCFGYNFHV